MRHAWGVVVAILGLDGLARAAPVISEVDVIDLGQSFTMSALEAMDGRRTFVQTSLGCLVVLPDLSAPAGLFACDAAAPPGATPALVRSVDQGIELRDADGKLIRTIPTGVSAYLGNAIVAGDELLVTRLTSTGIGLYDLRLFAVDGTPLTDWVTTPLLVELPSSPMRVGHDGSGFVVSWSGRRPSMTYPEGQRLFVAPANPLDAAGPIGPITSLTDESDVLASRAVDRLTCGDGRCLTAATVTAFPGGDQHEGWAIWGREAGGVPVLREQVVPGQTQLFDRGGRYGETRYLFSAAPDYPHPGSIVRVDGTTGQVLDPAPNPAIAVYFWHRVGNAAIASFAVDGNLLHATRIDYQREPEGTACTLPEDCASNDCAGGTCAALPDPDAGPIMPDAGVPDAGSPDAGTADVPDAAGVEADAQISCPQGGSSCEGTGCSCQLGHQGQAAPLGALLCLGLLALVRRGRRR